MAQLDQLPVEILGEICSYLCIHCLEPDTARSSYRRQWKGGRKMQRQRRHALAMLCCTSAFLRSIAQPYLYHSLYQGPDTEPDFELFRITKILTADLGQAVKRIELHHVVTPPIAKELAADFARVASRYGIQLAEGWANDESTRSSLVLDLLLLLARGASVVRLATHPSLSFEHLATVVASNDGMGVPRLSQLRTVALHWDCGNDEVVRFQLDNIAPLLRLAPNMNTLVLFCSYALDTDLQLAGVTTLNVFRCRLSSIALGKLIESCARLQVLNVLMSALTYMEGASLVPESFRASLQKHKDTLRSLSITMVPNYIYEEAQSDQDLSDFKKLESLWINVNQIKPSRTLGTENRQRPISDTFLANVLPKSIRRLCLLNYPRVPEVSMLLGLDAALERGGFPHRHEPVGPEPSVEQGRTP
ncbi:hypothetical protein QBC34DRAFT_420910 [Podospora aff. communis PSN243]|uniref:F-box domain-containing protein n=1 Tax=Podospora aff. communis PSN243 TaxID=3040156 RepID=A0AAV9H1W3_9PEZI|nr:hypothetical protein QBC34DRAFT_420910 [Podospora aff. communis PSN243]